MPRTRPTFSFILAHRHQTTTGCMPKTSFALSAFGIQFKFFDIWPCVHTTDPVCRCLKERVLQYK